jgi:3-methyladenine DNA glycosylase AlkD
MPAAKKKLAKREGEAAARSLLSIDDQVQFALASLEAMATQQYRDNMVRFAITTDKAFGVSVADIQKLARKLGRSHELAAALWETGWYEARMLTAFVDEPDRVTPAQMDRWCRDFDNWGICDTLCFKLFDHTPYAWAKVAQWHDRRAEFVKRAAFALIASLAVHDKSAPDERFLESLVFIEHAAEDERNFVKKGVSWALRALGRRNAVLHAAAVDVARRLSDSSEPAARWVGRDAFRELTSPKVVAQLAKRKGKKS